MHAPTVTLLVAALPLAFAAPKHHRKCGRPGNPCWPEWQPASTLTLDPTDSAISPVIPNPSSTSSSSSSSSVNGMMSILPVADSDNTEILTNPLRTTTTSLILPRTTAAAAAPSGYDDTVKAQFAASTTITFEPSGALPTGLGISTDFIGADDAPYSHTFETDNVSVDDEGFLVLTVPGGQASKSDISSAEVYTTFSMLYGSVRTWAILTEEPGVCNGNFFFQYDSPGQETDIEFISDPNSQSNQFANNGTRALQYTNQAHSGDPDEAVVKFGRAPDDATSAVHEYRIDWTADATEFYLDGVFHQRIDINVPDVAGPWVWNNWANGDPGWTNVVPVQDAAFRIQKMELYYNPA